LTRQLLTFSRRQVVRPQLLNLDDIVNGFSNILRRLVEENVRIAFELGSSADLVSVDSGQIEQVLLNLVANARDAMPQGGTLTIATGRVSLTPGNGGLPPDAEAGAYVVLSVRDTGSGMSADTQSHLFEPFFTTKPAGRGTGLGLATVYGIVKQSGGHISVHSQAGSGTTFSIYLPVASATAEVHPALPERHATDLAGSETVLIVEDNGPLRRVAAKMLQRHGYQVLVAADGAQAQQICSDYPGPIPVVIMDVVMPGESGPSTGEWILQHRPDSKIIYTSGYTGSAASYGDRFRHGDAFLPKPFDSTQLARAIRSALSERGGS
jgi:CheY-like chemotaxis protein